MRINSEFYKFVKLERIVISFLILSTEKKKKKKKKKYPKIYLTLHIGIITNFFSNLEHFQKH